MQHLLRRCCTAKEIQRTLSATATNVQEKAVHDVYVNLVCMLLLSGSVRQPLFLVFLPGPIFFYLTASGNGLAILMTFGRQVYPSLY